VYLTFIWTLFDALFTFSIAYLRSRRQIKWISVIQAALAVSKVIIIIALAESGLSLEWIVASIDFDHFIVPFRAFFHDYPTRRVSNA